MFSCKLKLKWFDMFSLVLVIITYRVALATDEEIPVIEFKMESTGNGTECLTKNLGIWGSQPLLIRVNNTDTIRCPGLYSNLEIPLIHTNSTQKDAYYVKVDDASKYGNDNWICVLKDINNNTLVRYCKIVFYLRGPLAQIFINKELVTNRKSPYMLYRSIDFVTDFFFQEHEMAEISCQGSSGNGLAKLKHMDSKGRVILITKLNTRPKILLKLTKYYDKTFVDCDYHSADRSTSRLRLHLQDQNTTQSIISLHIDGMIIRTKPNAINYTYHHVYYEEEETQITCELRNDEDITLQWYHRGIWETKNSSQIVNETLFFKNENYMTKFICAAIDINTKYIVESVIIELHKNTNDFCVVGLQKRNILKVYEDENSRNIIYYQYTDGERLNLKCILNPIYDWYFLSLNLDDENVGIKSIDHRKRNNYISHVFKLEARTHNSVIECEKLNIIETYKKDVIKVMIIDKNASVIFSPDDDNNDAKANYVNRNTEVIWIYSAIGFGALIIINIVAYMILRNRKNKRNANDIDLVSREAVAPPHPKKQDEPNYSQLTDSNDDDEHIYSEIDEESRLHVSRNTNEDGDPFYEEIGDSVFDSVVARIELAKTWQTNQLDSEKTNETELESPDGYCIMRPVRRFPLNKSTLTFDSFINSQCLLKDKETPVMDLIAAELLKANVSAVQTPENETISRLVKHRHSF